MAEHGIVAEKPCSKCKRILPAAMFNKAKWLNSGLRPDCKNCYSETKRKLWAAKPKSETALRKAENAKLAMDGKRRCKTCGSIRPADSENFATVGTGDFNSSCRECDRAKTAKWAKENADRYKATAAAGWADRHAKKLRRSVSLAPEHRAQIKAIYAECRKLNKGNPRAWHVDHIMPLRGKNCSGLHAPWNLRIVQAQVNVRKSNRITENCSLDAAIRGAKSLLSMIAGNGKT